MAENRKKYTREFKVEAARLLDASGKSGHEIEKGLGMKNWQRCARNRRTCARSATS